MLPAIMDCHPSTAAVRAGWLSSHSYLTPHNPEESKVSRLRRMTVLISHRPSGGEYWPSNAALVLNSVSR